MLLSSKSWNSWDLNRDAIKEGYTEITFEQFKKYVLKQETMEKEIIGYKTPYNMYGGQVKKGDIWTLNKYDNGYQSNANVTDLPKEIVEQWKKSIKKKKLL